MSLICKCRSSPRASAVHCAHVLTHLHTVRARVGFNSSISNGNMAFKDTFKRINFIN